MIEFLDSLFDEDEILKTYLEDIKRRARVESRDETFIRSIICLMDIEFSMNEAMDILKVPESDRQRYKDAVLSQLNIRNEREGD